VHYRALFVRKNIQTSDIAQAKFEFGPKGTGPMQRIVFVIRKDAMDKDIVVNTGLFDGRQCRDWLKALNTQLGHGI